MGSRAIRAIRGDAAGHPFALDDGDAESEEDYRGDPNRNKMNLFASVDIDDGNESSSSASLNSSDAHEAADDRDGHHGDVNSECQHVAGGQPPHSEGKYDENDLDALISAFQQRDVDTSNTSSTNWRSKMYPFSLILKGINFRDMDIELSMRLCLRHGGSDENDDNVRDKPALNRRRQHILLFGCARNNWPSPPKYLGGGIGMRTYTDLYDGVNSSEVPWPYSCDLKPLWFSFLHSDTFRKDNQLYQTIQNSGDVNALLSFVIQKPYHCPALLQLSTLLYQLNYTQEGLAFLRRCLWTYDMCALDSFVRAYRQGFGSFLDADKMENQTYFQALFKLMQVATRAGLHHTSFAMSRYILSLDPLRDPMNLLVIVDHFCMATDSVKNCEWLINLIDSDTVQLNYRENDTIVSSGLLSLPNWAFAHALAWLRLYHHSQSEDSKIKANTALQTAISNFPFVTISLLRAVHKHRSDRPTPEEWDLVLNFVTELSYHLLRHWDQLATETNRTSWPKTYEALEMVTQVFVQHNSHIWSNDDAWDFLYSNLLILSESPKTSSSTLSSLPSAALMRYLVIKLSDYEYKIDFLPQGAVMLDETLIIHAMAVDTNQERDLLRRYAIQPENRDTGPNHHFEHHQTQRLLGPPTQEIDPDWPLVEVFVRSFLPWNRVTIPPD